MKLEIDSKDLKLVLDLFADDGMDPDLNPQLVTLRDMVKQAHAKLCLVRLEETREWSVDDMPEKIWGVYLVDLNETTYCCEISPSYTLYWLYTTYTGDESNEAIDEYVNEEDVKYVHCTALDALPAIDSHPVKGPEDMQDIADDYEEFIESYVEYYRANHCF